MIYKACLSRRLFAMTLLVTAALFSVSGCGSITPRADWSTRDTVAEVAFQTINVIDALQTNQLQHRPDLEEGMPFTRAVIGREPSTRDTAVYFTSLAISHYLISLALPAKWRPWFQGATVIGHGATIAHNCEAGLLCE